jgi:hypothetical protein
MLARSIFPVMAIAVLLSMHGQSLAHSRTANVCWSESKILCPAGYNGDNVKFFLLAILAGILGSIQTMFVIRCAAPLTASFAKLYVRTFQRHVAV